MGGGRQLNRVAVRLTLLMALSAGWSLPAKAQGTGAQEYGRQTQIIAKKQAKLSKKANKKNQKQMKKNEKAQRKAQKKAAKQQNHHAYGR
jgi:hypothetical protein